MDIDTGDIIVIIGGWFVIGSLVALVLGKILREVSARYDKPSIPIWRPERRIQVRRARDHGVEVSWHQVDQRHGFGRRHTDRSRKLP